MNETNDGDLDIVLKYLEALKKLPAYQAKCYGLLIVGFSYQQIANMLKIQRGTVARAIHDARNTLLEAGFDILGEESRGKS